VAPTAAEYRLLGANQAFLAVLRSATGGGIIATPADPWIHDLATTSSYTDLWPFLLILALLLWPLDIALRRVSVGRRELVGARRWVTSGGWRRRRVAPRPVEISGMLAARDRASGSAARAAMIRGDTAAAAVSPAVAPSPSPRPGAGGPTAPSPVRTQGRAADRPPSSSPAPAAAPARPATPTVPPDASKPAEAGDTLARLREAKRRARGE
jgi:hypothetical protein